MSSNPSGDRFDRLSANIRTAEDAIGWCLSHRDSGQELTDCDALATFPEYADELQDFFDSERALFSHFGSSTLPGSLPKEFGRFQLQSMIGRGSFGEVRKAWDTKLSRMVALKTPRVNVGSESARRRLIREAQTASQLSHPNIVHTYEVGETDDTPYICMEFVEGVPLNEWHPDRPIAPNVAATMASQIAAGLAHAHGLGIVHRDLNPRNVLINADTIPRILDFGLAKWNNSQSTVTLRGEVMGTAAYVSPEQASGRPHDVDGRSDIFSLGAVLYELITGHRPFRGEMKLLLHQIRSNDPVAPSTVNDKIPLDLSLICMKSLAKAPDDRYPSALKFKQDLDRFLAGKPIQASAIADRGGRWFVLSKRTLYATAVILGLIAAVGILLT